MNINFAYIRTKKYEITVTIRLL